ncbi:hypothetical protein AN958_11053 [Leucoagaricus sp. SymC.cos]|nr:hypothetical protein AN958_11053 [Leucoagaricus sp. SymC.cos]
MPHPFSLSVSPSTPTSIPLKYVICDSYVNHLCFVLTSQFSSLLFMPKRSNVRKFPLLFSHQNPLRTLVIPLANVSGDPTQSHSHSGPLDLRRLKMSNQIPQVIYSFHSVRRFQR